MSKPDYSSTFYKSYFVCTSYQFTQFIPFLQEPSLSCTGPKNFLNILRPNILGHCSSLGLGFLWPKNFENMPEYDPQKINKYLTKIPKNSNILRTLQSYLVLNKYL
jgi:hypothetical protein